MSELFSTLPFDNPDGGAPILSAIGPYGPYLKHNKSYANISNLEEFLSIGMNRAVELISDQAKKVSKSKGPSVMRTIGEHPDGVRRRRGGEGLRR